MKVTRTNMRRCRVVVRALVRSSAKTFSPLRRVHITCAGRAYLLNPSTSADGLTGRKCLRLYRLGFSGLKSSAGP